MLVLLVSHFVFFFRGTDRDVPRRYTNETTHLKFLAGGVFFEVTTGEIKAAQTGQRHAPFVIRLINDEMHMVTPFVGIREPPKMLRKYDTESGYVFKPHPTNSNSWSVGTFFRTGTVTTFCYQIVM